MSLEGNGDFPYDLIGSMDETPVCVDMVSSKTVLGSL
jgi:hypothetical protein